MTQKNYFTCFRHQEKRGLLERRFHELSDSQWEYVHRINQFAYRPYRTEYIELLRGIYQSIWQERERPRAFRNRTFRVDYENLTFEIV